MIPSGVQVPDEVAEEADPPEVLFAGRLSPEKGILELVEAARGMKLVVAGDGPLRDRVPGALGFVPHDDARAAVRAGGGGRVPVAPRGVRRRLRGGDGYGRPVVAGAVGGLLDLVVDGETGLLVPPRDVGALRAALERLLGDSELRRRLGRRGARADRGALRLARRDGRDACRLRGGARVSRDTSTRAMPGGQSLGRGRKGHA